MKTLNDQLFLAVRNGTPEEVLRLLSQGASLTASDGMKDTMLHYAALGNNTDTMRLLLKLGASPVALNHAGRTPLITACITGNLTMISLLLQRMSPAEADWPDNYGENALYHLLSTPKPLQALTRLLDGGANPVSSYRDGLDQHKSAYQLAVRDPLAMAILQRYAPPPSLHGITRNGLLRGDDSLSQHPVFWHNFAQGAATLERQGTPLTKADLLAPYEGVPLTNRHHPVPLLARAAECSRLHVVLDYLNARGEQLTPDDLLTPAGQPNDMLETILDHGAVETLFREENWLGQSGAQLRRLWRALPAEQQAQITNYRQLLVLVDASTPETAKGR